MSISLLCDEHIPYSVVKGLRRRGLDVVTVQEKGLSSADDEEIMQYALNNNLCIYTRDTDFLRHHKAGSKHAGIIYHHPLAYSIGEAIRRILILNEVAESEELKGRIKFL